MKFTAFTIACQAALTLEQCIRSHAPLVDHYIAIEGVALNVPTTNGNGLKMTGGATNSTDGTVEILKRLEREIPNLAVVYAKEPWQGKTAMCNEVLKHAQHGWLWQIDADEFWKPIHVGLLKIILEESSYTDAEVWMYHHWPTLGIHTRLEPGVWGNTPPWRRWFKWDGEPWVSHEPPRLNRPEIVLDRDETRALGIIPHHFGYVAEQQFRLREKFYGLAQNSLVNERNLWLKKRDLNNSPHGRLETFVGDYPLDVGWLKDL